MNTTRMGRSVGKRSDAELLASFVETRDQTAFAELVSRHGSLVSATAQRILGSRQDAEDAAQAAFFALAKCADRMPKNVQMGGWLHQAAVRCARSIGRDRGRWRRNVEARRTNRGSATSASTRVDMDELKILDREISRLPAKLRDAIVACGLEDRTRKEVAQELGVSTSTIARRMAAARAVLRKRLARHGVTLSVAALVGKSASAARATVVDAALANQIANGALRFTAGRYGQATVVSQTIVNAANEVTQAMIKAKLLSAALLVMATLTAIGTVGGVAAQYAKAGPFTVVTPNDRETLEGSTRSGGEEPSPGGGRVLYIIASDQFPSNGVITELRLRPDASVTVPSDTNFEHFVLRLGTTSLTSPEFRYENNFGPDRTVVFDGPLAMSTDADGPPQGPRPFDLVIPFAQPFPYDPAQGNLIVDFHWPAAVPVIALWDSHLTDSVEWVGEASQADVASLRGNDSIVMQFQFVPEPDAAALIAVGLIGPLALARLRRW